MTKPNDIPQDVWDAAVATEDAAHVAYGASLNDPYQSIVDAADAGIEVIARAIMAEREACAQVAEESLVNALPATVDKFVGAAIRNRS